MASCLTGLQEVGPPSLRRSATVSFFGNLFGDLLSLLPGLRSSLESCWWARSMMKAVQIFRRRYQLFLHTRRSWDLLDEPTVEQTVGKYRRSRHRNVWTWVSSGTAPLAKRSFSPQDDACSIFHPDTPRTPRARQRSNHCQILPTDEDMVLEQACPYTIGVVQGIINLMLPHSAELHHIR